MSWLARCMFCMNFEDVEIVSMTKYPTVIALAFLVNASMTIGVWQVVLIQRQLVCSVSILNRFFSQQIFHSRCRCHRFCQEDPWNRTRQSRLMIFDQSRDIKMSRVNDIRSRDMITWFDHKFWSQILITKCDQFDHKVWSTWSQSVINLITKCDHIIIYHNHKLIIVIANRDVTQWKWEPRTKHGNINQSVIPLHS